VLACVITTRNEAPSIGGLVRRLTDMGIWAWVIDDNSTDGTGLVAAQYGAHIATQQVGRGISGGLMQGWNAALAWGADLIIQMDAGGSHSPEDVPFLVAAVVTHDVAIGSRFLAGSTYIGPCWRSLGSRIATVVYNVKTGGRFSDVTSGFRAYRAEALDAILNMALEEKHLAAMHGFQLQVLHYARRLRLHIAEVPIAYKSGRSSLSRQVALEALGVWWRL